MSLTNATKQVVSWHLAVNSNARRHILNDQHRVLRTHPDSCATCQQDATTEWRSLNLMLEDMLCRLQHGCNGAGLSVNDEQNDLRIL